MMKKVPIGLVLSALLFALCSTGWAQQSKRIHRIGYLSMRPAESERERFTVFRQALRQLGYGEGDNIIIEFRHAPLGQLEKVQKLAAELVNQNVEVIVASSGDAARAAKEVTSIIPIVFTVSADPVGEGLVQSLARPGVNVTGLSDFHGDMLGKRLELLKEVVPTASRVAFLWASASFSGARQLKDLQSAAPAFGVTVLSVPVKGADDIDRAFAQMRRERPGGLVIHGTPLLGFGTGIRERVVKSRIPHIFTTSGNVDAGGLMSYGANHHDLWRRAAMYVDRILKGANPANLPVQQPTKFELVINLNAAKEIGLTIPPNLLARADRVIR